MDYYHYFGHLLRDAEQVEGPHMTGGLSALHAEATTTGPLVLVDTSVSREPLLDDSMEPGIGRLLPSEVRGAPSVFSPTFGEPQILGPNTGILEDQGVFNSVRLHPPQDLILNLHQIQQMEQGIEQLRAQIACQEQRLVLMYQNLSQQLVPINHGLRRIVQPIASEVLCQLSLKLCCTVSSL